MFLLAQWSIICAVFGSACVAQTMTGEATDCKAKEWLPPDNSESANILLQKRAKIVSIVETHDDSARTQPTVCVSLLAYEEPAWIDALIHNLQNFGEDSTKVAIHLDSTSTYSEASLARWETDRVTVSPQRVNTKPFFGGILMAHMVNARTMRRRWQNECSYYVQAASNMFWLRAGWEEQVRTRQYGMMHEEEHGNPCTSVTPVYVNLMQMLAGSSNGVERWIWSYAEGQFFPMQSVDKFVEAVDSYMHIRNETQLDFEHENCYLEELALPTYVWNQETHLLPEDYIRDRPPLVFRWQKSESVRKESIPLVMLKAIAEGSNETIQGGEIWKTWMSHPGDAKVPHLPGTKWKDLFAAKRITRDPQNKVTKYALSLFNHTYGSKLASGEAEGYSELGELEPTIRSMFSKLRTAASGASLP